MSARDGQVHTSPLLKAYSTSPSTALSKNASSFAITSAKKMLGDLPPSSVVDGMMFWAAYCMISRPVTVSPVKATLAMRLLVASALPISAPGPFTMLSTPGGRMSAITSASLRIDHGVGLAGLSTVQLPAASAGATFHAAMSSGKLNGMICPTTPSGSWKWYATVFLSTSEILPSSPRITRGEVAEVVGRKRDVGGERLAHRLAVVPALGDREHHAVLLDRVGDARSAPATARSPTPRPRPRGPRGRRRARARRRRVSTAAPR